DKWTMLILRDIGLSDKHFYKDFMESGEGIATNVLSDRLKMLESYGIIQSKPFEPLKTKKYYTLTERGIELIPIIVELWSWGARYDPKSAVATEEIDRRGAKKEKILAHYIDSARKSQ
ncbi:MAG: helix-turn-helix domain-containing protein, partial [Bacteroidota bacterium]